jgi:hypothetical protein
MSKLIQEQAKSQRCFEKSDHHRDRLCELAGDSSVEARNAIPHHLKAMAAWYNLGWALADDHVEGDSDLAAAESAAVSLSEVAAMFDRLYKNQRTFPERDLHPSAMQYEHYGWSRDETLPPCFAFTYEEHLKAAGWHGVWVRWLQSQGATNDEQVIKLHEAAAVSHEAAAYEIFVDWEDEGDVSSYSKDSRYASKKAFDYEVPL